MRHYSEPKTRKCVAVLAFFVFAVFVTRRADRPNSSTPLRVEQPSEADLDLLDSLLGLSPSSASSSSTRKATMPSASATAARNAMTPSSSSSSFAKSSSSSMPTRRAAPAVEPEEFDNDVDEGGELERLEDDDLDWGF